MADQTTHTPPRDRARTSGALALVVVTLIAAVAALAWFIFGAGIRMAGETVSPALEIEETLDSLSVAARADAEVVRGETVETTDEPKANDSGTDALSGAASSVGSMAGIGGTSGQ